MLVIPGAFLPIPVAAPGGVVYGANTVTSAGVIGASMRGIWAQPGLLFGFSTTREQEALVARTVVYAEKTATTDAEGRRTDGVAADGRGPDGVASKIAKYVPVETVTLATFFFAVFDLDGAAVWVFVALGAAVNVAYLLSVSRAAADTPNPRIQFYVLSAIAFVLWSLATIDTVAKQAGLDGDTNSGQRAFVLALAAFSMPMLDTLLSARVTKTATEPSAPTEPSAAGPT
jgi:uncharacterized membrane protein YecN with MAPEG domain